MRSTLALVTFCVMVVFVAGCASVPADGGAILDEIRYTIIADE